MNDKFDELTKGLAQSVTRRSALKKFAVGLVGVAVTLLGFASRAQAGKAPYRCRCTKPDYGCDVYPNILDCLAFCGPRCERTR